jgi:hypothetical protein
MAKRKQLFGKAPLTIVRTNSGTAVYVYRGRPAPGDVSAEERDRLLGEGYLEEREIEAEDTDSGGDSGDGKPTSIKAILKDVGDDKVKAQAYLDEEQAKPVDDQRSTLIASLAAIVDAGA